MTASDGTLRALIEQREPSLAVFARRDAAPERAAFSFCRWTRGRSSLPVIPLTAAARRPTASWCLSWEATTTHEGVLSARTRCPRPHRRQAQQRATSTTGEIAFGEAALDGVRREARRATAARSKWAENCTQGGACVSSFTLPAV
jgi:DNA-binding response OmpR family regulator